MALDQNWKSIGELAGAITGRLREQQMRREFIRRIDQDNLAALCAAAGVSPESIPDAPMREAAE